MNIENINVKIKELSKIKKLLNVPINDEDTLEEKIFKKYLELENVSKVAEYINNLGYRINGNNKARKYIANDISLIITNKDINLKNKELKEIVMKLFKGHKRGKKRTNW